MHELSVICEAALKVVNTAVIFIREQAVSFDRSKVQYKGYNDLVSYVDKTSEEILVQGLSNIIPESGFITEENTNNTDGETYTWIIDPLDGTTNFIHGVPCYCISVALMKGSEVVLGIVHEVNLDECFYSYAGIGTMLGVKAIKVSDSDSLSTSLIVTGFPYTDFSRLDRYMEVFDYCMKNTHGIRRPGSAAVDLAYVAAGRYEAFYEYGLNSWDVAAGAFLVKQAGGVVTDFSGSDNYIFGKEIIACNKLISKTFIDLVSNTMKVVKD